MSKKPTWIHLAGNPPNVKLQEPPYWRIRVGSNGKEYPVDSWQVTGTAMAGNVGHGIELNASFLLWWELFGELTIEKSEGKRVAKILLRHHVPTVLAPAEDLVQNCTDTTIRVFGAPDRVSQQSKLAWRCKVGDQWHDLAYFRIRGNPNTENTKPGEDITHSNPLQRLWLEFHGRFKLYDKQVATIFLA